MFAIVTWGCAGSRWLARTLNGHPKLFCVHALNGVMASVVTADRIDGVEYLQLLGIHGKGYAAAGDVHGVSRELAAQLRSAFGKKNVSLAVLVRAPEIRLLSQLALFETEPSYDGLWDADQIEELIEERGLELPEDGAWARLFVHGANMLNAICEEIWVGPVFRMEDLTSNPASLRELITHISGGRVRPDRAWCKEAVISPATNRHRTDDARALQPWQKEVVRRVVSDDAWSLYDDLGYSRPAWLKTRSR